MEKGGSETVGGVVVLCVADSACVRRCVVAELCGAFANERAKRKLYIWVTFVRRRSAFSPGEILLAQAVLE